MPDDPLTPIGPWWREPTRAQWYVFVIAALGWIFDGMDTQLFIAVRSLAMRDLMPAASEAVRTTYGGYCTGVFIVGFATGGLVFGVVADRWGRVNTMVLTILLYGVFTGLSGLARDWVEFAGYRFLTGLGIGGEFAAGAALVAEVMPEQARVKALALLMATLALGTLLGAWLFGVLEPRVGWRGVFLVGSFPALFALLVRFGLKEPARWIKTRQVSGSRGSWRLVELLADPDLRRRALVGLTLAFSGITALWATGFYTPELIDRTLPRLDPASNARLTAVLSASNNWERAEMVRRLDESSFRTYLDLANWTRDRKSAPMDADVALSGVLDTAHRKSAEEAITRSLPPAEHTRLKARGLILQQLAAFFGMNFFGVLAFRWGRRRAFATAFAAAWMGIAATFLCFRTAGQVWWLWPILGFTIWMPFAGYSIYFAELFPTRLRSTGIGFCYNAGRYLAALGPPLLGLLAGYLDGLGGWQGFRLAAVAVGGVYVVGWLALLAAPETKGQRLED